MSCQATTSRELRAGGRRTTSQRTLIACALRAAGGHRTAREIYELVAARQPDLPPSTVYRALEALRSVRIVSAVEGADGRTRYTWVDDDHTHLHLTCRQCGASQEVDGAALDALRDAIRERASFEPFLDHVSFVGLCAACRGTGAAPVRET